MGFGFSFSNGNEMSLSAYPRTLRTTALAELAMSTWIGSKSLVVVIDPEGEETNQPDAWSLVWDSIVEELNDTGGGKPLDVNRLIQRADRKASAYFRKRKQNYVVVTSLSVALLPKKRIRINGCEVAQLRERGSKYPLPDSLNSFSASGMFREHVNSSRYATVRVKVSGRTVFDAYYRGMQSLRTYPRTHS